MDRYGYTYTTLSLDPVQLSRVYTPCARMRRQPAQMSKLAAACTSPLHSASCAVDKSINRRAYASVYVRIRPYAEQRVGPRSPCSAFVIGWNACAGLRWPWKFNMFELWRRQSAYARVCAGRNRRQKYKQLRRQSAYARAWSINPALHMDRYCYTYTTLSSDSEQLHMDKYCNTYITLSSDWEQLHMELGPSGVSPNQHSQWKHAFSLLNHV